MHRLYLFILLSLVSLGASAAPQPLDVAVENYLWQEFDNLGDVLLTESGPRYVIGYRFQGDAGSAAEARLYLGNVGYYGQLMGGTPSNAITGYYGLGLQKAWYTSSYGFAGEWGGGVDMWGRTLDLYGPYGYMETYLVLNTHLGLRYRDAHWHARAGVRQPLLVQEVVSLGLLLNPQPQASLYAELAYAWPRLRLGLYYDSYRFAASPPYGGYYQPTSNMDAVGLRFHFTF